MSQLSKDVSQLNKELLDLFRVLNDDVTKSLDELGSDPNNQFKRRTVVHFFFALIEGETFRKKQWARVVYEKIGLSNFSERHIAWLKEETYGQKFPRFEDNFKFAFQAMSAVVGIEFDLNLGHDPRWQSFRMALEIRNRITHPKHVHDMTISDEEIVHVTKAFYWFSEKTRDLHDLFLSQIRFINRILKERTPKGDA
jgi:hypothetical protein